MEPTARGRKVRSGAEQKRKEDDEALGPKMVEVSSQTWARQREAPFLCDAGQEE